MNITRILPHNIEMNL